MRLSELSGVCFKSISLRNRIPVVIRCICIGFTKRTLNFTLFYTFLSYLYMFLAVFYSFSATFLVLLSLSKCFLIIIVCYKVIYSIYQVTHLLFHVKQLNRLSVSTQLCVFPQMFHVKHYFWPLFNKKSVYFLAKIIDYTSIWAIFSLF